MASIVYWDKRRNGFAQNEDHHKIITVYSFIITSILTFQKCRTSLVRSAWIIGCEEEVINPKSTKCNGYWPDISPRFLMVEHPKMLSESECFTVSFFLQDIVTESCAFDMVNFMPLLRERIYTKNPFARQFIVSWVSFFVIAGIVIVNTNYVRSLLPCTGLPRHRENREFGHFSRQAKLKEFA